ncbi:MAG: hypothetical protein LBT81_03300 [Helicobacteraceae bacterium]|jgi:hypothetical protein|nr:hypothetical protein [Helicobacteraceae bacterium]
MMLLYPKPLTVIASEAIGSGTVPEWQEGSYSAGDKVIRSVAASKAAIDVASIDYIFEAGVNTSDDPADGSLSWLNKGASEAYKVFDDSVSTLSSYASGSILEIRALKVGGVFLARFNGTATLEVFDSAGDTPFFSKEVRASSNIYEPAVSWTTYFFRELVSTGSAQDLLFEVPSRVAGVRIRLTALTGGFSIGKIIAGIMVDIGETRVPPSVSIIDYSIKAADESGNIYIKERAYSKRVSFEVFVKTARFDQVADIMSQIRSRPTVFIGDDLARFNSLSVYGVYRDFSLQLSREEISDLSFEVEGLA